MPCHADHGSGGPEGHGTRTPTGRRPAVRQQASPPTETVEPAPLQSAPAATGLSTASPASAQVSQPAAVSQTESGTGAAAADTWGAEKVVETPEPERTPDSEEALREEAARRAARENPVRARDWDEALQREALLREQGTRERDNRDRPAALKGLVIFKVTPSDASIYVDHKFIGTSRDLAEGIWIQKGDHSLAIVRPGYTARELTLTVTGESLDVEIDLQR